MEANDRTTNMTELEKCLQLLEEKGFLDEYEIRDGQLHCLSNNQLYAAADVVAVNFYRFEGASDPDDMAILYAIETHDGRKGTVIDAYGTYADQSIGDFMNKVETHKWVHHEKMY